MSAPSPMQLERIYGLLGDGRCGPEPHDMQAIKPNTALLRPIRPPKTLSNGLRIDNDGIPGKACLVFEVVGLGPRTRAVLLREAEANGGFLHAEMGELDVSIGDTVFVANAALDEMSARQDLLRIDTKWLIARLEPESVIISPHAR